MKKVLYWERKPKKKIIDATLKMLEELGKLDIDTENTLVNEKITEKL